MRACSEVAPALDRTPSMVDGQVIGTALMTAALTSMTAVQHRAAGFNTFEANGVDISEAGKLKGMSASCPSLLHRYLASIFGCAADILTL